MYDIKLTATITTTIRTAWITTTTFTTHDVQLIHQYLIIYGIFISPLIFIQYIINPEL